MLGPLPRLYRVVVGLSAVVAFVGLGAWAAQAEAVPMLDSAGAVIGAGLGLLAAYALVHEQHARSPYPHRQSHRQPHRQSHRVRRPHP